MKKETKYVIYNSIKRSFFKYKTKKKQGDKIRKNNKSYDLNQNSQRYTKKVLLRKINNYNGKIDRKIKHNLLRMC